ncbi:multidrug resistance protein MdtN [Marinomonas spartinae]|uniref:efflux RND transporter periplasmic adaptor subunit n=1 Tax=Marinomonas spartinae TaxID=1792290 RepID=UPI000808DB48|nr:efflux RND transporter periplasmic adaptor subunit [Marinomonas spartinae]SBS33508.1 multidrug resistance protein MdtN [Marinomonas spartinae]
MKKYLSLFLLVIFFMPRAVFAAVQENARGILVAVHQATLSSELAAKVIAVPKQMGETFKKGDTLIQLDCRLFNAQLEKVDAEAKAARAKLDNVQQLNRLNSIGTLDVAIAEADLQKVQAERLMAQLNVARCDIKAPFSGSVEQLDIHPFEIVQQRQALMKIVGHERLEADIIVPAQWMTWLAINKTIVLQVEETKQRLQAVISHIGPSVDPTSQTIQIRAAIKKVPVKVLPGMSVVAEFR